MTIKYCDSCNTRYLVASNAGDYIHDCSTASSATLANEDVLAIHTSFTNPDGSSGTKFPADVNYGGIIGKNWMSRGDIENNPQVHTLTTRGNPVQRYRTRTKFNYIENPDKV
ncbi:MAG: hypothetical protein AABY22_29815 [Nanoarchaeota archaeon]